LGTEFEMTSRFSTTHLDGFTMAFRNHLDHARNLRHDIKKTAVPGYYEKFRLGITDHRA
jgi:hypothetical protein